MITLNQLPVKRCNRHRENMVGSLHIQEHAHVHFEEANDSFGKDNELVVQHVSEEEVAIHMGFLKLNHLYEVKVSVPWDACDILGKNRNLESYQPSNVPNLHCQLVSIVPGESAFILTVHLKAHKEKLQEESLWLAVPGLQRQLKITYLARVLGKNKGTPLLRNGVRGIAVDEDEESEASDWQGFESLH
uniref:Adipose-secreted signaling protein n=1 Tax=Timema poppense TaxID=170557 RepID=A0A7R9H372_TIMPO|nr:unnamed protein product [Timema poppensis]